MVDLTS